MANPYFIIPKTGELIYNGDKVVLSEFPDNIAIASYGWYTSHDVDKFGWYFLIIETDQIVPKEDVDLDLINKYPKPYPNPPVDDRAFITVETVEDLDSLDTDYMPDGRIVRVNTVDEGDPLYYQWDKVNQSWATWDIYEYIKSDNSGKVIINNNFPPTGAPPTTDVNLIKPGDTWIISGIELVYSCVSALYDFSPVPDIPKQHYYYWKPLLGRATGGYESTPPAHKVYTKILYEIDGQAFYWFPFPEYSIQDTYVTYSNYNHYKLTDDPLISYNSEELNCTYSWKQIDTYNKPEIDNIISSLADLKFEIVEQLPSHDIHTNVIYLVPNGESDSNIYDEWIYVNNAWESLGTTQLELSDYVKKSTQIYDLGKSQVFKNENNDRITIMPRSNAPGWLYDNKTFISLIADSRELYIMPDKISMYPEGSTTGTSAEIRPGAISVCGGYNGPGATYGPESITCWSSFSYSLQFKFPIAGSGGKGGTFAIEERVDAQKQDRFISSHVENTPTKYYKYASTDTKYKVDTFLDSENGNFTFLYSITSTGLSSPQACTYRYNWQRPCRVSSGHQLPLQQIENNQTWTSGVYTYYGRYANDYQEGDIFIKTSVDSQTQDDVIDSIFICENCTETIQPTYNQYDYAWVELASSSTKMDLAPFNPSAEEIATMPSGQLYGDTVNHKGVIKGGQEFYDTDYIDNALSSKLNSFTQGEPLLYGASYPIGTTFFYHNKIYIYQGNNGTTAQYKIVGTYFSVGTHDPVTSSRDGNYVSGFSVGDYYQKKQADGTVVGLYVCQSVSRSGNTSNYKWKNIFTAFEVVNSLPYSPSIGTVYLIQEDSDPNHNVTYSEWTWLDNDKGWICLNLLEKDYYTKTEIDSMIGDIETLLSEV